MLEFYKSYMIVDPEYDDEYPAVRIVPALVADHVVNLAIYEIGQDCDDKGQMIYDKALCVVCFKWDGCSNVMWNGWVHACWYKHRMMQFKAVRTAFAIAANLLKSNGHDMEDGDLLLDQGVRVLGVGEKMVIDGDEEWRADLGELKWWR